MPKITIIFGNATPSKLLSNARQLIEKLSKSARKDIQISTSDMEVGMWLYVGDEILKDYDAIQFLHRFASVDDDTECDYDGEVWEVPNAEMRFQKTISEPVANINFGAPHVGMGYQYQPRHYIPSQEINVQHAEIMQEQHRFNVPLDSRTRAPRLLM